MEFEIKRKDFGGRIGKITIGKHQIETPTILPVINPNLQTISADKLKDIGAEILITNAYIIYKNQELKKKVLEEGLHELIGFDGPIMTDSGAYQLSVYGDVEVSSDEIIDFQKDIGSDIIVPLDIPTSPDASKERAKEDLKMTMERLKKIERDKNNFAGPIQGSKFFEIRKKSAKEVGELDFDLYCIGGVVPMMESYDFEELSKAIIYSKKNLPLDSPVHLFGAGHPMTFALATLLGCDLFDSAAYALFAKRGKYLTNKGTWDIKEMNFLPCSCPICEKNEIEEIKNEKEKLALHNLYVTFEEIRTIKESIRKGKLFELTFERCRAHPKLISGLKIALEEANVFFEELTPRSKKSAFFYQGEESLLRPEIRRNMEKITEMNLSGNILLFSFQDFSIKEKNDVQVIKVLPPFVYPKELNRTYPFGQSVVPKINEEKRLGIAKKMINNLISTYKEGFEEIKSVGELEIEDIENINEKKALNTYSLDD